jgi:hypothetical protein
VVASDHRYSHHPHSLRKVYICPHCENPSYITAGQHGA